MWRGWGVQGRIFAVTLLTIAGLTLVEASPVGLREDGFQFRERKTLGGGGMNGGAAGFRGIHMPAVDESLNKRLMYETWYPGVPVSPDLNTMVAEVPWNDANSVTAPGIDQHSTFGRLRPADRGEGSHGGDQTHCSGTSCSGSEDGGASGGGAGDGSGGSSSTTSNSEHETGDGGEDGYATAPEPSAAALLPGGFLIFAVLWMRRSRRGQSAR